MGVLEEIEKGMNDPRFKKNTGDARDLSIFKPQLKDGWKARIRILPVSGPGKFFKHECLHTDEFLGGTVKQFYCLDNVEEDTCPICTAYFEMDEKRENAIAEAYCDLYHEITRHHYLMRVVPRGITDEQGRLEFPHRYYCSQMSVVKDLAIEVESGGEFYDPYKGNDILIGKVQGEKKYYARMEKVSKPLFSDKAKIEEALKLCLDGKPYASKPADIQTLFEDMKATVKARAARKLK